MVRRVDKAGHHGPVPQWWRRRPRVWFYTVLAVVVVIGAGWAWFLTVEGRAKADQWSSSAGFGVSALVVVVPLLAKLWRRGMVAPAADDLVAVAVKQLVQVQHEQWTAEQAARQVQDPYPLPVRWEVSDRAQAVMASWAAVRGRPGGGPIPMDGRFDRIATVFTGPRSPRRLVVIGEPGAGKSMLVLRLTVDLLTTMQQQIEPGRHPADPIPVMLSIGVWDPEKPLLEWVAERLAADNPPLRRTVTGAGGGRRSLAAELVATGRILPILDGLDEIAPEQHPAALAGIEAMAAQLGQFVLTCRSEAYEAAVSRVGSIARTPVVEIQPLVPHDVSRYLKEGTDDGGTRWARVAERLESQPASPVARVLTTPLYTWLARTVYRQRHTHPDELLDADWARTAEGIEEHLLDGLIPAVFATAGGGHRPRTTAQTTRAHRHLAFLAGHLHRRNTYDLSWWQLQDAIPRWQIALVPGLLLGLVAGTAAATAAGLWLGPICGLLVGLPAALVVGINGDPAPRRIRVQFRKLASRLMIGFLCGSGIAFVFALGLVYELLFGLLFGLVAGFTGVADDWQRSGGPSALLREDRMATVVPRLLFATLVGVAAGSRSSLWSGLLFGLAGGLVLAPLAKFVDAIVDEDTTGRASLFGGAWQRFLLVRCLLAGTGRVPWRLMTFLQEAHDRGLLRQAGAVYQFRHARLQDYLVRVRETHPSSFGG